MTDECTDDALTEFSIFTVNLFVHLSVKYIFYFLLLFNENKTQKKRKCWLVEGLPVCVMWCCCYWILLMTVQVTFTKWCCFFLASWCIYISTYVRMCVCVDLGMIYFSKERKQNNKYFLFLLIRNFVCSLVSWIFISTLWIIYCSKFL